MVRSWGIPLLVLFAAVVGSACVDDASAPSTPAAMKDAGHPDAATPAPTSQRYASATATLRSLLDDAADGGTAVTGEALFAGTREGVDLEIELQGCAGEDSYPVAILQAADCSPESLRGPLWSEGRSEGLPALFCTGTGAGRAATGYERASARAGAWSIGDRAASDVVGHALVVRDAHGAVLACGVIERAPDLERRAVPPDDQAPLAESRAAIGGLCLARQFAGSSAKCPDSAALLRCEAVHCDFAGCLDTCTSYTSCLDQQADVCSFSNGCQASAECVACQGQMQECAMYYCGEHMFCGALPTPDGPCQRMAGCCALQGNETSTCMGLLLPFLAGLGGDANCLGSMQDWDVVSHLHVPCTFGPGEPSTISEPAQPTSSAPQLADDRAGAACTRDADCSGGNCARSAADGGGFCTRACDVTSECGRGGMCTGGQSLSAKQCLATCLEQADCRDGFVCNGRMQGAGLSLPGVCSPKRRVESLSNDVVGRACQDDAACGGGECAETNLIGTGYPGNYCTGRCYDDAQCGRGGVCLWTRHSSDPGYCLQHCAADADCTRKDYGCWELGDGTRTLHACYPLLRPLPDGRAGQACSQDADCAGAHARCAKQLPYEGLVTNELQPAPGGYCTQACALDRECGMGAQCINSGSTGGLCLANCSSETPCRDGYTCFAHSRDNDERASVCVTRAPF